MGSFLKTYFFFQKAKILNHYHVNTQKIIPSILVAIKAI